MLEGALLGAIGGIIGIIIVFFMRSQRYNNLMKGITDPGVQYSALFYYASPNRYQKSFKFYDSYGILYLIGNTVYYKTSTTGTPIAFNLAECRVQQEPDWRKLKWLSISTPAGEKYYFVSFKQGAFVNNSDETLKALSIFRSKIPGPPPPPIN
ncbi:MAG TPA: hypothetical protein VET23_13210 [Chitinophagaceae bacterium]|nr:hypothetical protein [Chitinophagaceae bacterium]